MKTEVVHSLSKNSWNVHGTILGDKFKICRVPYIVTGDSIIDTIKKHEALQIALFISKSLLNYKS